MENENENAGMGVEGVIMPANSKWYTVQVMSGQENRVVTSLKVRSEKDRANGIDDGLDDILLPTQRVVTRSGAKDIVQEKKCYPGYVFVRARIYDEKDSIIPSHWLFIRDTKGVINFMGGEKPIELTEQEIMDLTAKQEEKDKPKAEKIWHVGDVVIVKEGAFQGFEGIIENVDDEKHRLNLSVQIFGRSVPCETDFWQVDFPEEPRN